MESNHRCSMSDWVTASVATMAATPRMPDQMGLTVGAESEGFEPPMGDKPTPVFKTGAFSQTLPTLQSVRSRSNISVGQGGERRTVVHQGVPLRQLFTLNRYPGWDSNPQQIGFKPITSASWVTRAYPLSCYGTSIHRWGMSPQVAKWPSVIQCPSWESNPHASRHPTLNRTCLPVPSLGQRGHLRFPWGQMRCLATLCRDDTIRTCDLLAPNQTDYQAFLHPVNPS